MTNVEQFHNLAHIFISFIGAILLLAIYSNIRKRFRQILEEDESQKRVDSGLLYLSLAMFVWVGSGIWAYASKHFEFSETMTYQIGVNLLSIVNNLFLLMALFYFYYAPKFIYNNIKNVKIIIGIIIAVASVTLVMAGVFGENNMYANIKLNAVPDLILSGFLCFLLLISFYKTFLHRGLKLVAMISVVIMILIFASQLPEVFLDFNDEFTTLLIKIIAKTSLIALFLVLATSWVIQLANTPRPNEMRIRFLDWSLIQLSIPSKNINNAQVDFGSKTTQYKNLLKFAIRRANGKGDLQSILVSAGGEIKNQTYLTRIIENINEILQLSNEQQLERRDLFTFLGEGKYRLRMIPENISIDEGLLHEFIGSAENTEYSSLCN
ncbi:hypothetical protein U8527_06035 [Kordia algicida OT-1]|uniref:Uncharacterized protein n=1 Tax=Kordia algicida OT-1 TaxID=391587 RepID=A9E152_9FLAO|nr:hypothetical protein [Kordia algicida]EDP95583.1 hypothetical protein KAOT1_22066 [Kordia algicida OT-1]